MQDVHINQKKVVGSMIWKLGERIIGQGVNLIVQIILARLLLPSDFGSLAIIVAIINYAAIFVHSGLSTAIVQKEKVDDLDVSTLFSASLVIALALYLLLFFLAPFIANFYDAPILKWTLRVLSLVLFLNAFNSIQTAILSRMMQFRKLFIRTLLAVPISGGVGILMAYLGFGVWALVVHNLVNMLVVVLFMSFDKNLRFSFKFSFSRFKKLYGFSLKILGSSLVSGANDTARTMVIGRKYSKDDLAYYDKALVYSGYVTQIVNTSVQSVLLPVFSRKQKDRETLRNMARRSVKLSAFLMFPVLIGVAMMSKPLVLLVLGQKWAESIPYLAIFCVLRIPGCIMSIDKQVYYAEGRSGINLFYEIGLFIANIATLLFTMQYGVFAVAIGSTVVELVGGLAICIISHVVYGYKLTTRCLDLAPVFFCTTAMALCIYGVTFLVEGFFVTILLQFVLGVLVYFVVSFVLNKETMKYVLNMIKNITKKKEIEKND